MRISDWSSDVCSSDLTAAALMGQLQFLVQNSPSLPARQSLGEGGVGKDAQVWRAQRAWPELDGGSAAPRHVNPQLRDPVLKAAAPASNARAAVVIEIGRAHV